MFGAIMKTYYAEKFNIDPAKMVIITLAFCRVCATATFTLVPFISITAVLI